MIGPPGSGSNVHYHTNAWCAVVYGRKRSLANPILTFSFFFQCLFIRAVSPQTTDGFSILLHTTLHLLCLLTSGWCVRTSIALQLDRSSAIKRCVTSFHFIVIFLIFLVFLIIYLFIYLLLLLLFLLFVILSYMQSQEKDCLRIWTRNSGSIE